MENGRESFRQVFKRRDDVERFAREWTEATKSLRRDERGRKQNEDC